MSTMKVKPWGEGQGDHVVINAEDFNPEIHLPFEPVNSEAAELRAELDAALEHLPGDNNDPEYVVNAMRNHFGDVFTDADEDKVRELVKKDELVVDESKTQEPKQPEPSANKPGKNRG